MKNFKLTDLINQELDNLSKNKIKGGAGCSGGSACSKDKNGSSNVSVGLSVLRQESKPIELKPLPYPNDTIPKDTIVVIEPRPIKK